MIIIKLFQISFAALLAYAAAAPGYLAAPLASVSSHSSVVAHPAPVVPLVKTAHVVAAAPVVPVVKAAHVVPVVKAAPVVTVHSAPIIHAAPVVHTAPILPVVKTSPIVAPFVLH